MKTCSKCQQVKSLSDFGKDKSKKDGLRTICKECDRARSRKYHHDNRNIENQKWREWAKQNRETLREKNREHYQENKEQYLEKSAKRRATKLRATPGWFSERDREVIREAYAEAKRLEELTGIPFHVDHIVPLQAELACGFHCADNIQILPAYENLSKGNRLEV